MVVLNFYGKIKPVCISQKLRLFLSNLPDNAKDDWKSGLVEELAFSAKVDAMLRDKNDENTTGNGVIELYKAVFPGEKLPEEFSKEDYFKLADRMICIYQRYDYSDMPLGGWDTNCFDSRFCEEDYSEKIVKFINFVSALNDSKYILPRPVPQWVYSSNHDEITPYRIFWGGQRADDYVLSLLEWGRLFDDFLKTKNDYLRFDYLVNAIYKDDEYNEYHLMKEFSLCQLFLEKENESELDKKLPCFFRDVTSKEDMKLEASYFRKMRNKIAHGDFLDFEKVVEEYASKFMDGTFSFDYSEYSRKNWVILHVCCELDDILRRIICVLLYNREKLEKIQKMKG